MITRSVPAVRRLCHPVVSGVCWAAWDTVRVYHQPVERSRVNADDLATIDAYWRAANYLSVCQIYLYDNPLLRTPLERKHIKPRLLGHWGTTPGLNFIYAHLNRAIV